MSVAVQIFPTLYSVRSHIGRLDIDHAEVIFIPQKFTNATNWVLLYCFAFCLLSKSDGENDNNVG